MCQPLLQFPCSVGHVSATLCAQVYGKLECAFPFIAFEGVVRSFLDILQSAISPASRLEPLK